ncbi:cation:proton antiporter regulatory subunit [Bacillus testis]|uniref:cation:proton antiporter regulatory subunit n=1 Tax=Bacillus testis TaxID=1622072 RepID=UPI00067ED0BE|nr:cation:proton antiporter regulatory subunit [Bacillus testis]
MDIRESELPGIGKKYEIVTKENEKLVIVIHDDGRREIYHFDKDHEESISNFSMNNEESKKVAAILGGMVYEPKAIEQIEMAFEGLLIEWFKVEEGAAIIKKTIGDIDIRSSYSVNIIAILKKNMKKMNTPGPEDVIEAGDTLVISGERPEVKLFVKELLRKTVIHNDE